jgi:hypothetical protein
LWGFASYGRHSGSLFEAVRLFQILRHCTPTGDLFASWEPIEDVFPDVDDGLLPLPDVELDGAATD